MKLRGPIHRRKHRTHIFIKEHEIECLFTFRKQSSTFSACDLCSVEVMRIESAEATYADYSAVHH